MGAGVARAIAMSSSEGLVRGMSVLDTGAPISVPVGEGVLGRGLRASELRRATPYNTYVIDGLPPTPIANPGRAALEAVLTAPPSTEVFFVADGTGGHVFATSYDDHRRNVAQWRRIERQQAAAAAGGR